MLCSGLTREQSNTLYYEVLNDKDTKAMRELCMKDLFFLLTIACKRPDINKDWLYNRCREVEASPNGHLDLWAREHYKSTIITFGKSIQDIISNPDHTLIGIFSHTRGIAKGFLDQIKRELESNTFLKNLFPDVLYENPQNEAPKWSLNDGIIVKRTTNPKESTVEAWGLVDGQPTSKHFTILLYDDVVTLESVTTPEQIKKTTAAWEMSQNLGAAGGVVRYIGTRYHANDTYKTMMDRGSVIKRIYPATHNGKQDGDPVFLDKETLAKKRRDQGPYTFACFAKNSPVLMADWTEKPIDKIKVGDEVVGYSLIPNAKSKLTRTKVIAVNKRKSPVIEATFTSGRVVRCTPDHKWYTGRRGRDTGGTDSHSTYLPLGFDKGSTKGLISVYDPRKANGKFDMKDAAWLGGFFDGEGSTSGNTIHFHQTTGKNLPVCEKLESVLKSLGYDYGTTDIKRTNPKWTDGRDYFIRGGREEYIRFLRQSIPARGYKIADLLFETGTRNFGKTLKDKLVSIKEVGKKYVYNIQTETGNYICYGYATKNCQMLQDPVADKAMGFKEEWLKYYKTKPDTKGWNIYIIVDPAGKKKSTNDYTVMEVIGLAPDSNYYLLDGIRDRLNLTERTKKLFEFHRKWKPNATGYEEYGMQSDIEHIEYVQEIENYRFSIKKLCGPVAKEDRIKKLIPIYEQHRFYMPEKLFYTDYQGEVKDYVSIFIEDEYKSFPVSTHDDMMDCRARILEADLGAKFPVIKPPPPVETYHHNSGDFGWMG